MALRAWQLVALATALAFGLALYRLGHDSLWLDEITTWQWAHLPFARIRAAAAINYHPPLYFQFMHEWIRVGASPPDEFWLRLPSAFFFAWTVPVVYLTGRILAGSRRAGVYAAFLAATFPFLLHYGQEARAYAMLMFFATCGFAAAAHLVCGSREDERPRFMQGSLLRPPHPRFIGAGLIETGRRLAGGDFRLSGLCGGALRDDGAWVVYIVASIAVMKLHSTAGIYPAVTGLILFCALWTAPSHRGVRFANLCIAMAIIALVYLPWIPQVLSGVERIDLSYGLPTPDLSTVFDLFRRVYGNEHFPGWSWLPFVVLASLAVGTMAVWARRGQWQRVAFAGIGWLGAPVLLTAFSFWSPILIPRVLIWTLGPFLAACGAGLALLPTSWMRVVLPAALLSSNLQGVGAEWRHMSEDWRSVARIIAREAAPDVAVMIVLPLNFHVFDYYWSREGRGDISAYVVRVRGFNRFSKVPEEAIRRGVGGRWVPPPVPPGVRQWPRVDPAGLFSAYRRIRVVWGDSREGRTGDLMKALEERGRLVERQRLPGLHLLAYERRE